MKLLYPHSQHRDAAALLKRYNNTPISAYADVYSTGDGAALTLAAPFTVPNTLALEVNLALRRVRAHTQNIPAVLDLTAQPLSVVVRGTDGERRDVHFVTLLVGARLQHAADLVPHSAQISPLLDHQAVVTLTDGRVTSVRLGVALLRAFAAAGVSLRIYTISGGADVTLTEALLTLPDADGVLHSGLLLPSPRDFMLQREAFNAVFVRLRVRFHRPAGSDVGLARVVLYSGASSGSSWTAHGTATFCARSDIAFVVSLVQRTSRAAQLLLFNDGSHSASSVNPQTGVRTPRWVPENPLEFPTTSGADAESPVVLAPHGYSLDPRPEPYAPLRVEVPAAIPPAGSSLRTYAHPDAAAAVQAGHVPAWLMLEFNELSPDIIDAERRMRFSVSGSDPFGRLRAAGVANVYVTLLPEIAEEGALPPYTTRLSLLYINNDAGDILSAPCPPNTALEPVQFVSGSIN